MEKGETAAAGICAEDEADGAAAGDSSQAANVTKTDQKEGNQTICTKQEAQSRTVVLSDDPLSKPPPETQEEDDSVIFHCVSYLGAANIQEAKSEAQIQKIMGFLNENSSEKVIKVSVSVPLHADGFVIVYEEENQLEISRFGVTQIIFFARGLAETTEWACFAFTCSHGETLDASIFQCHVFRCDIPEAVARVFASFARAFDAPKKQLLANLQNNSQLIEQEHKPNSEQQMLETFNFEVSLEFKEDDGRGNYSAAPRGDKGLFKLRGFTSKHIILTVQQVPDLSRELIVERCFGLLLSPGRHVRDSDMNLVEMLSWSIGSQGPERKSYVITGQWDANDPSFESLNKETPKDSNIFLTVAVDLVVKGVQEPLRFALEVAAKIYPTSERFWTINRKHRLTHQFAVALKRVNDGKGGELYQFVGNTGLGEVDRNKANFAQTFTSFIRSRSMELDAAADEEEEPTDDEEPQSGEGVLTKECSDEQISSWSEIVAKWPVNDTSTAARPKQLTTLVRQGIPDTVRGEMWLRLANCHDEAAETMENYRRLLCKDCPNDDVIRRDITRTFSANDYFRESGGTGQELLYKLSKAYAVYDNEVGYCQGLTFIGAALLLQMPEEQSFCLLIKIMFDYEFRNLYRDGFENLRLKLYQLDRLIEDQLPEIHTHFLELGIESHMYASQWLLTLYTAKFPLIFVFRVLDLFLLDGIKVLFQVAVALLSVSRKDLLMLDFEGVLKYFRITLPKKYRKPESTNLLMKEAVRMKVKRLKKFETEYMNIKEQEKNQMNPLERLQLDNKRLIEDMIRNEHIITELVLTKANYEDTIQTLEEDLNRTKTSLKEVEDFNEKLKAETNSVKELFQREVKAYDSEGEKKSGIIVEYKRICSKLSTQLEEEQKVSRERMGFFQSNLCETCSAFVSTALAIAANKAGDDNNQQRNVSPSHSTNSSQSPISYEESVQPLENELAKTKIALAESECRNDDLNHQLAMVTAELESYKNSGPARIWRNLPFNRDSGRRSIVSIEENSVAAGAINGPPPPAAANANNHNNLTSSMSLQGISRK